MARRSFLRLIGYRTSLHERGSGVKSPGGPTVEGGTPNSLWPTVTPPPELYVPEKDGRAEWRPATPTIRSSSSESQARTRSMLNRERVFSLLDAQIRTRLMGAGSRSRPGIDMAIGADAEALSPPSLEAAPATASVSAVAVSESPIAAMLCMFRMISSEPPDGVPDTAALRA